MNTKATKKPKLSAHAQAVKLIFACAKEDMLDPANDVYAAGATPLDALKSWESAARLDGCGALNEAISSLGWLQAAGVYLAARALGEHSDLLAGKSGLGRSVVKMRVYVNAEVARRARATAPVGV